MTEARVVKASYCNLRPIPTRGQLQLILELPLEEMASLIAKLGVPAMPGESKWVAVALLNELVASETEHQRSNLRVVVDPEMELARKQSVMLAKNPDFIYWASKQSRTPMDKETSAQFIRDWCGVDTRGKIATDREAYNRFTRLKQIFDESVPGRMAENRG